MSDVFLSYSREDQAVARRYAEALEREGFGVWWDMALNPGETFDKVTEQALRDAKAVVVLWSKRSVDSRWVRSEASQADRYGTLVPVMIEPCERPILFELAHTADLSGWGGDTNDIRFRTLVESVRRLVGKGGAVGSGATARIPAHAAPVSAPGPAPRKLLGWAAAAVAIVAAIAIAITFKPRDKPAEPGQLMRFTVSFQDNVRYSVGEDFVRSASISPDGKRVVFTGSDQVTGEARIYIRNIDSEQATPLPGALEGTEPFWSPDSKSIGFYAGGKVKIASIESGQVRELANAPATGGASWNDQGQILISLQNPGPLVLIPAAGGTPKPVTLLEPGDLDHDWPQFLDDGVHFLYMAGGRTASNKVFLASLASPDRTLLMEGVPAFAYASPDRIIFLKNGVLLTQVLDVKRAALVGEPVVLAENALPPFSASRTGAMTYRTVPTKPNPLIWIKPDGTVIGDASPAGFFVDPQISPDGKQLALAMRDSPKGNYDVAILDLGTKAMRKLTLNPANDRDPVWSPDGKTIVFLSTRPEAPGLYRKNSDGTGGEELILPSKDTVWAYQWTPGRLSFFDGLSGALDIGFLSGPDLRARTMVVDTPFNDVDGAVSPDGRWLAYTSNATGRWEMYLTSLEKPGTTLPITSEGGCDPTWNRDGTMLYYTRTATSELMAIPVTRGNPPTFGAPRRIHPGPLEYASAHSVDIDPRGDRLVIAPGYAVQGDLTVLVNWQSAKAQ